VSLVHLVTLCVEFSRKQLRTVFTHSVREPHLFEIPVREPFIMFSACVTNLEDSVMAMGGGATDQNNGRDQGEGESGSKLVLYDKG